MTNMKLVVPIVVVILLVGILGYVYRDSIGLAITGDSQFFLRPTFGFLACDEISCPTITQSMSGQFGQSNFNDETVATRYTCQEFIGLNQGCSITLQTTDGDIDKFLDTNQQLSYQLVPDGTPFRENEAEILSGGPLGYDNDERVTLNLRENDILWVRFTEGTLGFLSHEKVDGKVNFVVSGTCFTIYDHNDLSSRTGQPIAGAVTGECLLRNSYYKDRKIFSFSTEFNNQLGGQELDWRNLNSPFRTYTYMKGIEPAPWVEGAIQTFQNQPVYCDKGTNNLYEIGQISSLGRTYDAVLFDVSGIVGSVSVCCEGDTQPGKVCENNQWISITESQCDISAGIFCKETTWTPYGPKQVRQFACVSNQCVPEIRSVACNFNEDCGSGKVCQLSTSPFNNKCVSIGTGDICDDNICSATEFKDASCPKDCGGPNVKEGGNLLLWIIVGFGIIIVILMLVMVFKRTRGDTTF